MGWGTWGPSDVDKRVVNEGDVSEGEEVRQEFNLDQHFSSKQASLMLRFSILFLIIAIIAGVFGFGGIAGTSAWIAQVLFVLFLILFVISFFFGRRSTP